MDNRYFSKKIVEWYQQNKRPLPWRSTSDPYKIWLSEIILQQTRINQGLPYYNRFVAKYPSVKQLALASEQEILRLWQGLGYYTRARNLHKCAKEIFQNRKSQFPSSYAELKTLPGIGEYTAAAIASFAFDEKVAVVDGNVYRVLSRILGIETPVNSPPGRKQFFEIANQLISAVNPGTHNQAMMEFGATHCVPVNPDCDSCIFKNDCFAFQHSLQHRLPVKTSGRESRERYFHYLVFRKGKSLLMKKRSEKDIWLGLYDFPLIERDKPVNVKNLIRNVCAIEPAMTRDAVVVTDTYKHVLTHQTIYCRFVVIDSQIVPPLSEKGSKFYSFRQISALPKPVLISRFLDEYSFYS